MFFGRTDVEAETPILWPTHVKSWLTGEDPDAGRDWGQEEKGTIEDEMAGWQHEFECTPGVGDGQGGLVCCYSWGGKESDTTERLNWTELNWMYRYFPFKFMISCLFYFPFNEITKRVSFISCMSLCFCLSHLSFKSTGVTSVWWKIRFNFHCFHVDNHLTRLHLLKSPFFACWFAKPALQ